MASVQEPCMIRLQAENPKGQVLNLFEKRVEQTSGGGNSADGTISISYEKWPVLPRTGPRLGKNTKLRLLVKLDAADGVDSTDGKIMLPITKSDGSTSTLTQASFSISGTTYDLPASTTAGVWVQLGADYEVTDDYIVVGGDKFFISVEDDTA